MTNFLRASLISTLFVVFGCAESESTNQAEPPALDDDFNFLVTELKDRHPDPFRSFSEQAFRSELAALSAESASLDQYDLVIRLRQIIAKLGDTHTTAEFGEVFDRGGRFALEFAWFDDGLYIIGADAENAAYRGQRVTAINDRPIEEITQELGTIATDSDIAFIKKSALWMMPQAGFHRFFGTLSGDVATFSLIDQAGARSQADIIVHAPGSSAPDISYLADELDHPTWINPEQRLPDLAFRDFWFPETGVYLIQYNAALSKENFERAQLPDQAALYPSFDDFEERVLARLTGSDVKAAIVDLRFNGGGWSDNGTRLAKNMAELPLFETPSRLFVATSEVTYSAGVMNAADFKVMTNAEFVGTTASGGPNGFTGRAQFVLPNSQIRITHSTDDYDHVDEPIERVEPDYSAAFTIGDFLSGTDPVLRYVEERVDSTTD